jgi:hypothetical protein
MALADSLNTPKASAFLSGKGLPPTPQGYVGLQDIGPVKEELAQARTKAEKDVGMADINIEREKQAQTIRDLEGQQVLAKKSAEDIRALPEREALKTRREEFTDMKFVPTKDTAQDIAGLFSLVNVIGMAMGGGGKQSAQQAMYAMNGMLEGYQKGRGDLYKKEKDSFDKNFKAMQEAVKTLEKDYEEAVKMYQYDKEAADIARKLALAKSGSSIFKVMEDRVGVVGTLNSIKDTVTSVDKAAEMLNKLREADDRRKFAAEEKAQARAFQAQQNEFNRQARRDTMLMQSNKLDSKEKSELKGIINLQDEITRLSETFKPEFANFKSDVVGDVAASFRARLRDNPEMAEWWRRYENVAIPERHSMFGATLTGNERDAWRKASIGTGNSTKEVLSWVADKQRTLSNKMRYYEQKDMSRTGGGEPTKDDPAGIL